MMSKFKKWLIHKLGGYTNDELFAKVEPQLKEQTDDVIRIKACKRIYTDHNICDINESYFKFQIAEEMSKYINPIIYVDFDRKSQNYDVYGYIDIPSKYVSKEYLKK